MPLANASGWSLPLLNGAATVGLLMTGLCASPVGAIIDRYSGQVIITGGSLGASLLLAAWSQIEHRVAFSVV